MGEWDERACIAEREPARGTMENARYNVFARAASGSASRGRAYSEVEGPRGWENGMSAGQMPSGGLLLSLRPILKNAYDSLIFSSAKITLFFV